MEKENKKVFAQVKNLHEQNQDVVEEAESLKKELEQKCHAFNQEVFLLRTDLQNQVRVKGELGAKIKERENQLREKDDQLNVLEIEYMKIVAQVKILRRQNDYVVEEDKSTKKELDEKYQSVKGEAFLVRADLQKRERHRVQLETKYHDKENQLREKEEQLAAMKKDKKEVVFGAALWTIFVKTFLRKLPDG